MTKDEIERALLAKGISPDVFKKLNEALAGHPVKPESTEDAKPKLPVYSVVLRGMGAAFKFDSNNDLVKQYIEAHVKAHKTKDWYALIHFEGVDAAMAVAFADILSVARIE